MILDRSASLLTLAMTVPASFDFLSPLSRSFPELAAVDGGKLDYAGLLFMPWWRDTG